MYLVVLARGQGGGAAEPRDDGRRVGDDLAAECDARRAVLGQRRLLREVRRHRHRDQDITARE